MRTWCSRFRTIYSNLVKSLVSGVSITGEMRGETEEERSGNSGAAGVRAGLLTTHLCPSGILRAAWSIILFYFILDSLASRSPDPSPPISSPRPPPPRREFLTRGCAGISFYRRIAFLVRDTSRSRDLRALRSDYGKCSRDRSHREIGAKPERLLNRGGV